MSVTVLRPAPAPGRFRLRRAGLIGLYEYEDETFEFEGGHLLLRGPNGAGKSKALELLLPLLLDGELRAERLDPFGGAGRTMRWNLLGEEDDSRKAAAGYSWLELERTDEDGTRRWVTLVLGVKANRHERGVRSWFAVLEASHAGGDELQGLRVGITAELTRGRSLMSRTALGELAGEVFETAAAYRARVNALLFGVDEDRYEAIVRLLLSLRKPQLSKTLDPQELSARLTEALPELDREAVLRVSARLDQLDRLRAEAAELREVRAAVGAFARTYRDYARAALRDRGGALTAAVEDHAAREEARRTARERAAAAAGRREELTAREGELDGELAAAQGAERELRTSEGWREAERLEELRRRAEEAADELAARATAAERAAADARELAAQAERGGERAAAAAEELRATLARLAAVAAQAGIAAHEAAVAGLAEEERDLDAVAGLLASRADAREAALARLRELAAALAGADRELARARERFEAAEAAQRERHAERARAAERLEAVRGVLLDAFEGWRDQLAELTLDDEEVERVGERLARAGDPESAPAKDHVAELATRAERALHDERAGLVAAGAGIEAERAPLAAERDRLEADEDPVPTALPFRTAERAGRPGAPLWALVDFAPELDAAARAGLEGALEGSSLLDAWVLPDGTVLDADDAALLPGSPAAGRSLAAALRPVDGAPVPAAVIHGVLACIAWPQNGELGHAEAAVAADGRFALGPLRGRHATPAARYIGAAARAAHRARRLAELATALAALDRRAREIEERRDAIDARLERVRAELAAFPDEAPALRGQLLLERAREEESRAAERTTSEQEAMAGRAQAHVRADAAARGHAREHDLPAPEDAAALDALAAALGSYRSTAQTLLGAERLRRERAAAHRDLDDRARRAGEAAATAAEEHGRAQRTATERAGAHEAAVGAVGATVEQLRARLATIEARATAAQEALRALRGEREEAIAAHVRAEADAARAADELAAGAEAVTAAHVRMTRLAELGAWALALGDAAPEDHRAAATWPLERTLAALRATSRETLAARKGLETLIADVDREADELRHRLAGTADFQVIRERVPEDPELTRVEVRHGGRAHPVGELEGWLDDELAARERTMADEDRRLFEAFLVGGLADALRERIADAGRLVSAMNQALAGCVTSSGMSIELQWRPREHDESGLAEAVGLLRRDVELLHDDARARLVEFLRRRIEDARASEEHGSTTEHVMAALDYRAWHEFRVIQVKDGRREVLTRRRHQQGSGGEKAVALHLPLFAAASAQFATAAAHAPRLILLDEAFAGIDERMRGQLLGLLERFDLDFVLTSHELWGCYPELSALGIYHLHREPGLPGVATAHFRWDGRRRVEVERAA
jgi:uncharacterized protein (TIGR02680 family)